MKALNWFRKINWRKNRRNESIRTLKAMGNYARLSYMIREAAFSHESKFCPHLKRTRWSFQKKSCNRSSDVMIGNIGPCSLDRCPIVNKDV